MEANDFVARLKADNPEKYKCDLRNVIDEYSTVLSKVPAKDRGLFGLNVLRTLCWNLEKVPKWRDNADNTSLLTLAIGCVRETRMLDKDDRVKTLACIYHIHRHAVRLNKPVPPELVLKISFMPFELDSKHLLKEYHKTYWNILTDRLTYIERLKTKANILKILPKLTEDITKVIQIYNTIQFCSTILAFLMKKLHLIYSDNHAKELSQTYKEIFSTLTEKEDVKSFKELTEQETFDLYMKLNDCLYIIADNSSKISFQDGILDGIVHTCISFVGHSADLFHCLQTFYLNFFCTVTSEKTNMAYVETVFGSLENSLLTTEKLGYRKAMYATYPYLNQMLRLYIEWQVSKAQKSKKFSLKIQESCLKLILFFMKKLKDCDQILKCENCTAKSGLHDALRLSFLTKHFVTICLTQKILLTTLFDTLNMIIREQYTILAELEKLHCSNYQKYYRKLQTDIHNCAISLNKAQYYEFSINLFEIYLKNELSYPEIDNKNITRALFNKSICELDCKLFEKALVDAFLSLIFSNDLNSDKYMSLVMDVKAKELKSRADDDDEDDLNTLQLVSVLDASEIAIDGKLYGDLTPFISQVKFSSLLAHEFSCYAKLWPSIAPVGGVWRPLSRLTRAPDPWLAAEDKAVFFDALCGVMLETPSVVRTMHSKYFSTIVGEMLERFGRINNKTPGDKLVFAALLCLQCEYDLAAASQKYEWKNNADLNGNPDNIPSNRTLPQEYEASAKAIQAVHLLMELMPDIVKVPKSRVRVALQTFQIFVPLLLQLSRDAPALQLAYVCMQIADSVDDHESYLRNAGYLLTLCSSCDVMDDVISRAGGRVGRCGEESGLVFLCDVAQHYISQGSMGVAARLLRAVQSKILDHIANKPELNLDLAVGRLLEVQNLLCKGTAISEMTSSHAAQRHYLAASVTGTKWAPRRLRHLALRVRTQVTSRRAVGLCASLGLHARALGGAAPALLAGAGGAAELRALTIPPHSTQHRIRIDNHLKRILGLQPCSEASTEPSQKQVPLTPKQEVEPMRDVMYKKNETSPSLPWLTVPPLNIPEFFKHERKCMCYACQIPLTLILTCQTASLEAQIYAFANENEIARNYFQGFLEMVKLTETKLKEFEGSLKIYEDFIAKSVLKKCNDDFKSMYVESLIQLAFFELKAKNFKTADGYIVEIHEILPEIDNIDPYITNEVTNLVVVSARLKETVKKPKTDNENENIVLTPTKIQKTPEKRPAQPPKQDVPKIIVKDEEVPKKRSQPKIIKIDDNDDDKDFEKPVKNTRRAKKDSFKVPNPIIPKPVLEEATPKPLRAIPKLLLTQSSEEVQTPNSKIPNIDFFTPASETPEKFFTPMTSIKTYTKKSLRHNTVKNLQQEFSTPVSVNNDNKKIKEDDCCLKENKPDIKEDRSSRQEIKSNVKSKFVIKEDDVNELSSTLRDKLILKENSATKEVKSKRREVSSAVKQDRSVIRQLNTNSKDEKFIKKEECHITKEEKLVKENRSASKETNMPFKEDKSVMKEKRPSTKQSSANIKDNRPVIKENRSAIKEREKTKKEDAPSSSRSRKDNLVRALSPGKLPEKSERESNTRIRRVRQLNLE